MFHLARSGRAIGIHVWHHHGAYLDAVQDETFCPRRARVWVLIAGILASAMGFMDRINTALAMPMLRVDLGSTLADAQWISNSYLLLMSSLILFSTAIGERFGLRRGLAAGILLFVIGALACALAPGTTSLIAARCLQGAGGALIVPISLAIVAKAYPKAERGKAIGIWAAASSLLLVVGPLIGGTVVTLFGDAGWRLLFALNLPIGGTALLILWRRIPADPAGEAQAIDFNGCILATTALLLIAFGLTEKTEPGVNFELGRLLAFVGSGALVLIGFIAWEARARAPVVPLHLFANRSFSGANTITFLNDFVISANIFFLPMALIAGWGLTAAEVSVLFLPLPVALTLLSEPFGKLADRIGPGPLVASGSTLVALSCVGLAITTPDHDLWSKTLPLMCVMAFGQGILVSPLSMAVMTSEADREAIVGSGVNNAISRSAWLLSVALFGGVAALVFDMHVVGSVAEHEGLSFGLVPAQPLTSAPDAIRVGASDAAYAMIAWGTALLAAGSAPVALLCLEWKRRKPSAPRQT